MLTIMTFMLLASFLLSWQTLQQLMLEDPMTGAGICRSCFSDGGGYEYGSLKGHNPFYISHFVRHSAITSQGVVVYSPNSLKTDNKNINILNYDQKH